MPEPDPQPPKPRAVSPARWLLMLLPSVLVLSVPIIADTLNRFHLADSEGFFGPMLTTYLAVVVMLCFGLGFRLDKWRHEKIESVARAVSYGFLILFVNLLIAFAGCSLSAINFK
ncbi:MAG: hypothetical protein ABI318_21750 [Chthoniobacteraceae bacterium]